MWLVLHVLYLTMDTEQMLAILLIGYIVNPTFTVDYNMFIVDL